GDSRDEAWDRGRYAAGVAARSGLFLRGDYLASMHLVARRALRPRAGAREPDAPARGRTRSRGAVDPRGARRLGQGARARPLALPLVRGLARSHRAHGDRLADADQAVSRPAGRRAQRRVGGLDQQAGRAGDVLSGVPGGGLARRALRQREAHRVSLTVLARQRAARAPEPGLPHLLPPGSRRGPRPARASGRAYAGRTRGQPDGAAAFLRLMIEAPYFSR